MALVFKKTPVVEGYSSDCVRSAGVRHRLSFSEHSIDFAASTYVAGGWRLDSTVERLTLRCVMDACALSQDAWCNKADPVGVQVCLVEKDGTGYLQVFVAPGVELSDGASLEGCLPVRFFGTK
jgi:hypothetical protein